MTMLEAAGCAVFAAAMAVLASWLPDAQALDFIACVRFSLAQGCLP